MSEPNEFVKRFVRGVIEENDTPSHRLELFLDSMNPESRAQATALLLAHLAPDGFKSVPAFLRKVVFAGHETQGTLKNTIAAISSTLNNQSGWIKNDETSGDQSIKLPEYLERVLKELSEQSSALSLPATPPKGTSGKKGGNAAKGRKTVRPKSNKEDEPQLTDKAKQFVLEVMNGGDPEANTIGFRSLSTPERLAASAILLHSRTLQDKGRFVETPLRMLRDSLTNKSSTAFDGMMERALTALRKAGVIRRSGKGERIYLPKELRTKLESLSGELANLLSLPAESKESQPSKNPLPTEVVEAKVPSGDTIASSDDGEASPSEDGQLPAGAGVDLDSLVDSLAAKIKEDRINQSDQEGAAVQKVIEQIAEFNDTQLRQVLKAAQRFIDC